MEEIFGLKTPLIVLGNRLFKTSLEGRLSKLLINKSIMHAADPGAPDLLVIDALDECSSREGICRTIEWIRRDELPYRFLLTIRPELEIKTSSFKNGPCTDFRALSLLESEADIGKSISLSILKKFRQNSSASTRVSRQSSRQHRT